MSGKEIASVVSGFDFIAESDLSSDYSKSDLMEALASESCR